MFDYFSGKDDYILRRYSN